MLLGKKVPYMNFDYQAIKITNTSFDYEEELNTFGAFRNNSCYETCFRKNNTLVDKLISGIIEASEHKLGHQHERKQATRDIAHINSFFKKGGLKENNKSAERR